MLNKIDCLGRLYVQKLLTQREYYAYFMTAAILMLKFPFKLKRDQLEAVESWLANDCRGSVIFSTGTGKTEIAFECARRCALKRFLPKSVTLNQGAETSELNSPLPSTTTSFLPQTASSHFSSLSQNTQGSAVYPGNCMRAFNILFLVPRIVLIEQNVKRLLKYGLKEDHIGVYYGEGKDIKEITIGTYQSVKKKLELIRNADMIILDEIHFLSKTATELEKIFDVIIENPQRAILGLTATIDEKDPRYQTIMVVAPPVKRYMIKDAVADGRLARPEIIPIKVTLTNDEQRIYQQTTTRIKEISYKLHAFDAVQILAVLKNPNERYRASLAKAWFANVQKRKELLATTKNKLDEALKIVKNHRQEPVMIFSETIASINKLKQILENSGIAARTVHNSVKTKERKKILQSWGKEYFALLSVHTLEIGYDIPNVRIAIIIANTSNINQIVQRIGRVIRKTIEKQSALIYVIYVNDTKEDNILRIVKSAINKSDPERDQEKAVQQQLSFETQ